MVETASATEGQYTERADAERPFAALTAPPPRDYTSKIQGIADKLYGTPETPGQIDKEAAAVKAKGDAIAGPIADYRAAHAQPVGVKPPGDAPVIAPPPSKGLHAFMAPVDGESPQASLQKLIAAAGVFATGLGMGSRSAKASLAALNGAMAGWAEGDKERADRAVADWKHQTDAALASWETQSKAYERALTAKDLDLAGRERAIKLAAAEADNNVMVEAVTAQGLQGAIDTYSKMQNHADALQARRDAILMSLTQKDLDRELKRELEASRDATQRQIADSYQRGAAERAADRAADQRARHDEQPQPGIWFDRETGERVYPTKGEFSADRGRYNATNQAGLTRYEQISIAMPMLKRLRDLVPKLLAEQPVENLVKAAELAAQGKFSSNPDLREFQALVEDANVKMTSVMGPGQFRVTLFNVLRGVGLSTRDTQETAKRVLDQWSTNIENDLRAITGQKLREHLSGPWEGWALSPTGERKWVRVPKGERIEPGWITVEEKKK